MLLSVESMEAMGGDERPGGDVIHLKEVTSFVPDDANRKDTKIYFVDGTEKTVSSIGLVRGKTGRKAVLKNISPGTDLIVGDTMQKFSTKF